MVVRNSTEGSCPSQKEAVLSSYACTGHNLLLWEKLGRRNLLVVTLVRLFHFVDWKMTPSGRYLLPARSN